MTATDERTEPTEAPRLPLLELVAALAVLAAAITSFEPLYEQWSFLWRLLPLVLAAGLVATLARARRLPWWAAVLAHLVVGGIAVAYSTAPDTMPSALPTVDTARELGTAAVRGWERTLDAILPVPVLSPTTVWLGELVYLAAAVTAETILRSRRVVAPILAPLGVFALSLPLVAATDTQTISAAIAVAVTLLVHLIVRSAPEVSEADPEAPADASTGSRALLASRLRRGIPLVLVCAVLGPVTAGALTHDLDDEAFDPRTLRPAEVDDPVAVNPLARVKPSLALDPPEPAFRIEYDEPDTALLVDRIVLAALDHYDGATWQSTARFENDGTQLDPGRTSSTDTRSVTYSIELLDVPGPWIPVAERPRRIDATDVLFDEASGTLVRAASATFDSYEVVSDVVDADLDDLEAARIDSSGFATPYTQVPPNVPETLVEWARQAISTGATPYQRLLALESELRALPLDETVASGHSLGRLERFLVDDQRGYAEQHAAAFALLARLQGFPTRVVVGYDLLDREEGTAGAALETVTSAEYQAWPEVLFEDYGWVRFDPTPDVPGEETDRDPLEVLGGRVIEGERTPTEERATEEPDPAPEDSTNRLAQIVVVAASVLTVAVLLVAGLVLAIKAARRHRRQQGDQAQRVLGAWAEATDRLVEVGVRLAPGMTATEVAGAGGLALGTDTTRSLRRLLPAVWRSAYADTATSDQDAFDAWEHEADLRRALTQALPWHRRVRARLDPRPLIRR